MKQELLENFLDLYKQSINNSDSKNTSINEKLEKLNEEDTRSAVINSAKKLVFDRRLNTLTDLNSSQADAIDKLPNDETGYVEVAKLQKKLIDKEAEIVHDLFTKETDEDEKNEFSKKYDRLYRNYVDGQVEINKKRTRIRKKMEKEAERKKREAERKKEKMKHRNESLITESTEQEFNDAVSKKGAIITFDNGEYMYVGAKNGKLFAGSATNTGIIHEYEIPYDRSETVDGNLNKLYDYIIEQEPDLLGEF